MKRSLRKIVPPTILLAGGLCAFLYGIGWHSLPVWADVMVTREQTILEAPPKELYQPRSFGPGNDRIELPPPPPRPRKVKIEVAEPRLSQQPECRVIREVSVGGITRLEDGKLQLTYGPGKSGPALCPT